mgnify:CR=1 FL=1
MSCQSCCQHGGACVLDAGHDGPHDSEYCTWTDVEAMPKEEADALFMQKAEEQGLGLLGRLSLIAEDACRASGPAKEEEKP